MSGRSAIRVLIVDDDPDDALLTRRLLESVVGQRYVIEYVGTAEAGIQRIIAGNTDICLLDYWLGATDGLSVFLAARAGGSRLPVIFLTGMEDRALDVAVMRAGAADFLPKWDLSASLLERSIRYALAHSEGVAKLEAQARELQKSNEDLEQFAMFVGHDLRAPMQTIASLAELLDLRYRERLDEPGGTLITRLVANVLRLDRMVADILGFAQVSGSIIPTAAVPLDRCVDIALADLATKISESGATVRRSPLPEVLGSETLLTQLFANLLGNAVKFRSERGPELSIEAAPGPDASWRVLVRDNGRGIPESELQSVFQAFRRGSNGRDLPGTGIGLAICRKIVERHGGTLEATSEVGVGTCFVATLRAATVLP